LFNLAKEEGKIEQYGQELSEFVQLLLQLPDLADAIQNPLYNEGVKKSVFQSVAEKSEMTPILKSFLTLLIEKDRIRHLGEIRDYYYSLIDQHNNVARAKVSAASHLDDAAVANISQALEKIVGKKIIVEFETDPELIGGVVARIGDLVLDGSVRTQLYNIKESLKRGELG
jgi:F-type H+-transporting ATPase subunit delta